MHNIYVLYGEETFLINHKIKEILEELLIDDIENKVSKYNLLQTNINMVIEDANTISLWNDKKVIICNDCYFLTGINKDDSIEHNIDELLKYIEHSNEDTTIIFTIDNSKLDERKKIVKELRKNANVIEFSKMKEQDLVVYAKELFAKDNYKIDMRVLKELVNRVEGNLELLHHEIEKLKIYKINEKLIDNNDVEELAYKPLSSNVFELIEAVINKNISRSLDLYHQLLIRNEEPIKIIVILANQFRLIYQTKKLYKMGYGERDIASKLDVHPYRIKLANEVNISEKQLLKYIDSLANLDINIKSGKINKDIGLEMFFLQL